MRRTDRTVTAATAVLAIGLAACGGSGGSDGDSAAEEPDAGALDRDDSPLSRALWGDESAEADPAALAQAEEESRDQEREVQEAVRQCMEEAGFEYEPFIWQEQEQEAEDIWADQADDPVAWAEQYGFGWSVGYGDAGQMDEVEDPNAAYVESLGESGQAAYYEALHGQEPDVTFDDEGNATDDDGNELTEEELELLYQDHEWNGCENKALEAVGDGQVDHEDPAFEQLDELYTDLEERIAADDEMEALEQQYADCMAAAGHEGLRSEEDAYERLSEFEQELELWPDPFAGMSEDEVEALSPEEQEVLFEGFDDSGPDPEKLAELKAFEIDLAVPNAECNLPIQEQQLEIRFRYEQELVDDPANAELIERIQQLQGEDGA